MGPPESSQEAEDRVAKPGLPTTFIEVIPHPHSGVPRTIVPLDGNGPPSEAQAEALLEQLQRPWAPFRTRADFEYTATAVAGGLSDDIVNLQLKGITGPWSVAGSMLTINSAAEMAASLAAAREYVVRVRLFLNPRSHLISAFASFRPVKSALILKGRHIHFNFNIVTLGNGSSTS